VPFKAQHFAGFHLPLKYGQLVPCRSTPGPFTLSTHATTLKSSSFRGRAVQLASHDSNRSVGRSFFGENIVFLNLADINAALLKALLNTVARRLRPCGFRGRGLAR
jgi:hypothetical protein